jgi:hypothetical protein
MYPKDDVTACLVDGIIDEEIDLFMGLSVSRYTGTRSPMLVHFAQLTCTLSPPSVCLISLPCH